MKQVPLLWEEQTQGRHEEDLCLSLSGTLCYTRSFSTTACFFEGVNISEAVHVPKTAWICGSMWQKENGKLRHWTARGGIQFKRSSHSSWNPNKAASSVLDLQDQHTSIIAHPHCEKHEKL